MDDDAAGHGGGACPPPAPAVREARADDVESVRALYAHEVTSGYANYEYLPPDTAEMRRRMEAVREAGLPWLVAHIDGRFAGYACATAFRSRPGYRWTVEDAVYVHPDAQRRGVGRSLLAALIERCTALGYRQMIAVIGDAGNASSIALHRALGFAHVATFRGIGWKAVGDGPGRWLDNVQMQRALGPGSERPPERIGTDQPEPTEPVQTR